MATHRTGACAFAGQTGSGPRPLGSGSRVGEYGADHRAALAGPVELAQEDVLPAREAELSPDDRDRLGRPDQPRLQVTVAVIVLAVVEPDSGRDELVQEVHHVGLDAHVPVL